MRRLIIIIKTFKASVTLILKKLKMKKLIILPKQGTRSQAYLIVVQCVVQIGDRFIMELVQTS